VLTRRAKPFRNGTSLAVILPADWARANLEPGAEVELTYDKIVRIRPLRKSTASNAGESTPGVPAARPTQPVATDEVTVGGAS
jgi:antitoxin component of MazEF toxin-antitoxin module